MYYRQPLENFLKLFHYLKSVDFIIASSQLIVIGRLFIYHCQRRRSTIIIIITINTSITIIIIGATVTISSLVMVIELKE